MTTQSIVGVQQRLASHYLDTLRRANAAINRGRGNRAYWYKRVEQDWGNIRLYEAALRRWTV